MVDPESGFFSGDAAELLKLRIEGLGALEVLTERLLQSDSAAVRQADGAQGGHGDGQRSRRQGQVYDDGPRFAVLRPGSATAFRTDSACAKSTGQ